MITSIKIERLRGIREGELTDLTPLVILTGPNGCGKSTVLDAMLIGAHPVPGEGIGIAAARHTGTQLPGRWLLWRAGSELPAVVEVASAEDSTRHTSIDSLTHEGSQTLLQATVRLNGERLSTHANLQPSGRRHYDKTSLTMVGLPAVHLVDPRRPDRPALDELWSTMRRDGRRDEANAALRELLPQVVTGDILTEAGRPVVYADFGTHAVPIAVSGDGVYGLVHLGLELAVIANGLALLEEPEAHLHPAAIWQAAKVVWAAVRRGVQVIISTHSLELIDALLAEAGDELEQLAVYSLVLEDGLLKHARFTGEEAAFSRGQIEQDLR